MTLGKFRRLPDDERDEMIAAHLLVCPQCGNLRSVCSDPLIDLHPQESVCWYAATQQWGVRRLQDEHKDFDPRTRDERGELRMSPLDGVSVWVSDVDLEALAKAQDDMTGGDLDGG